MLQRVVIAMAIASEPALLVLDEPTTGLDATVEAEVLDLVSDLRDEIGTSVLFISHNLAVIRKMCDRTAVLYAGRMMAEAPDRETSSPIPVIPTRSGLLRCLPSPDKGRRDETTLDTIPGFLPPLGADIQGCVYADRCGNRRGHLHRRSSPDLNPLAGAAVSRCHFPERAPDLPRTVAEKLPLSRAKQRDAARRSATPPRPSSRTVSPVYRPAATSTLKFRSAKRSGW